MHSLASIIIPCWNQLEFTRQCIAALARHTRAPWELIVIDNGSTDGTRDYLAGVQDAAPVPVTVIANATNRGFPAAINQGLKVARGEYLVLLNNDVVVTAGWLDQLTALAEANVRGRAGPASEAHDAGAVDPDAPIESVIGLVGPMSNYAAPPQLVADVPYRDLDEMHAFAKHWRDDHRGRWFTVPKLSGFCLLIKRSVYDAIGGLDERFGLGFFDDDDLAERARRAGFESAVAHDLFVHHFGSRTFVGNGIDTEKLLDQNAQRFATKWGLPRTPGRRIALQPFLDRPGANSAAGHPEEQSFLPPINAQERGSEGEEGFLRGRLKEVSEYRDYKKINDISIISKRTSCPIIDEPFTDSSTLTPHVDPRSSAAIRGEKRALFRSPASSAAKVSLTMIVRNEEDNLPHCLESARGFFDEIIVVDTGSIDRTKEIALQFGARVFDFVWIDDFSAARNAALEHATGDYAFWLDADDVIDPAESEKLSELLASLEHAARSQECGPPGTQVAYVVRCACDPSPDGTGGETVVDHVRLFPLRPDVRWTYRVHEQIMPALRRAGISVRWSDCTVRHTGYTDRALRARKLERDSRILREELKDRPDDPFVLFNLGSIAIEQRDWRGSLQYLKRSLARSAPTDSITCKLFALIARAHQMLGDSQSAVRTCEEGLKYEPADAELWFRKAVVHRHRGESTDAETCWRRILTFKRPEQFRSVDLGIYGHLTRRNLAALAAERGDHDEAERLWRAVLAECPGDREALGKLID
jgi:glycosyltransferase involved in cell wall biosynthesis